MKKLLSISNTEELKIALSALDVHVPARTEGRNKDQVERYSIAHLLASFPQRELSYPLTLIHQDKPDFVLQMLNREIGIEHIEAVPENHVRASIFRQKYVGPRVHLLQRHQPGESSRSNDSILTDIILDRAGTPWVGNEVEVEWARVMLHCIESKVKTLNKLGFTKFKENWLLIYDNWPLPGVHHEDASSLLADLCQSNGVLSEFNRILILGSKVLCDIGSLTRLYPVNSPSAGV